MKDRLYHLRKEVLGLSRTRFGAPVGMTDSEIKNLETGATQLKELKAQLICQTYGVRPEWLLSGEGDILQAPVSPAYQKLQALLDSLTDQEQEVLAGILEKLKG